MERRSGTRTRSHERRCAPPPAAKGHHAWLLLAAATACYVGIVTVRQGPPSGGDTVPLTSVTSELSSGQLAGGCLR